ncbi:reverse transcriptase [Caerostris darwini]|uniref:Reverse transcriptase n=1 Tax=Caerostris darwini TaxID=1538125 RepID=A0AAV4VYQ4_9ARAC|nr:reverse transcriptase [Caerostris darwini]
MFAEDLGLEILPSDKVIDMCKKIKNSPDLDEEFSKCRLDVILEECETRVTREKVEKETEIAGEEKEKHWVKPQETQSPVVGYVLELENNKNAVQRKFKIEDQVLVLATTKPNKIAVEWFGPDIIKSQLSETTYIVKIANENERCQIYHINLLKPCAKRPEKINLIIIEKVELFGYGFEDVEIKYPSFDSYVFNFEEIVSESSLEN